MKRKIGTLAALSLLWSVHSNAQVAMSASCSEPTGVRYDRINGKTERSDDGFTGVNPQFVLSQSGEPKLTVIWPDTSTRGAGAKQHAHEAIIIDIDDEMISAVVLYDRRVNLYTLFPAKGIAFMSTHKSIPLHGGIPSGSLFKLDCKFEFT